MADKLYFVYIQPFSGVKKLEMSLIDFNALVLVGQYFQAASLSICRCIIMQLHSFAEFITQSAVGSFTSLSVRTGFCPPSLFVL